MKKYIYLSLVTCCLLLSARLYADINISASVDRGTLKFGESVTLQVSVSGDVANIPKPSLPPLGDFNVYSSGTSQNISFVNGRVSSSLSYNYILSPNRAGKFTIGPVSITAGGKKYSTNPINIDVLAAGASQPQKQVAKQELGVGDEKQHGIFVTAQLDKKKAYVNEGIVYTFRFFTSKNLAANPQYSPPNFTGFMVEDLPPQKTYQSTIDGEVYNVIEVKTQLFAVSPGKYNLGPASLQTSVQDFDGNPFAGFFDDDFFKGFFQSGKPMVLKSKPLGIEIAPLPADKKPADFTGAVGSYSIKATPDKNNVGANNPLTITVEIAGEGNIKTISEPKIHAPAGVRKYDAISSINISKANYKVTGSKIFKTVLIPEMPGNITIPGVEFSYFNPQKREYQNVKSEPIQVKVTASKAGPFGPKTPSAASGVNIVGQDIRFINTGFKNGKENRVSDALSDILAVISCLLLVFAFLYSGYNRFVLKNSGFIKSKRAYAEFSKGIKKIDYKNIPVKAFYGLVIELIIKYLSDKAGLAFGGKTFREIESCLAAKNMPGEYIGKIREALEEADFMRFAPSMDKKNDMKKEAEKIRAMVSGIEKEWKI